MRLGLKDNVSLPTDIAKEAWYLKMAEAYRKPLLVNDKPEKHEK